MRKTVLLLISLFMLATSFGQSLPQDDSLKTLIEGASGQERRRLLHELAWYYAALQPDSSEIYARQLIEEATEADDLASLADAYKTLSVARKNQGFTDDAVTFNLKAGQIYRELDDTLGLMSVYNNAGILFRQKGHFKSSMNYFLKSMELGRILGRKRHVIIMKVNVANLYGQLGKYAEATMMLREVIVQLNDAKSLPLRGSVYSALGSTYYQEGKIDSALYCFKEAARIKRETGDISGYADQLNNLGVIYMDKGTYPTAYEYLSQSLEIDDSLGKKLGLPSSYANIGRVLILMDRKEEGLQKLHDALNLAKEYGLSFAIPDLYLNLAEGYRDAGNPEQAIPYLYRWKAVSDSLGSLELRREIEEMEVKYKTEQQAKEIALLEKANALKSRRVTLLWLTSGGLLLLMLSGGGMYYFYQKQKQVKSQQRLADLEHRALRAQMNPHFIFNSLNSIQMLFLKQDFENANEFLSDFGQLLRSILENSLKRYIPLEEEIKTIQLYLTVEQLRLGKKLSFEILLHPDLPAEEIFVPSLILQPFVENAIWHGIVPKSSAGKVNIEFIDLIDGKLHCRIIDDGVGLSASLQKKEKQHHSRGMQITKERLGSEDAVKIREIHGRGGKVSGTLVELIIPVKYDQDDNYR